MEFSIKSGSPEKQRCGCVVVGVFEQRQLSLAAELLDNAAAGALSDILRRGDMDGKAGTTLLVHNLPGSLCERVLLVGLGKAKAFHAKAYVAAIRLAHVESHCRYGSPNIHQDLAQQGISCCVNTVAKLMKENGIASNVRMSQSTGVSAGTSLLELRRAAP